MIADVTQSPTGSTATGKPRPDWPTIRREYEHTVVAGRALAHKYNIPYSTLAKRQMREHWQQKAKFAMQLVQSAEAGAIAKLQQQTEDELAPWIQEQKARVTRRGFNISDRALDRLESIYASTIPESTKTEAEAARTLETLVRVGRTSLGMSDGNASPGALSLNILTNQAAVQVIPPSQ